MFHSACSLCFWCLVSWVLDPFTMHSQVILDTMQCKRMWHQQTCALWIVHFNISSYQGHHKWGPQISGDRFVVFLSRWVFVFVFVSVYNHLHTSRGNTSDTSPKWGPVWAMIHHPVSSLTAKVMRKEPMQHWWGLAAVNPRTILLMADWRNDQHY